MLLNQIGELLNAMLDIPLREFDLGHTSEDLNARLAAQHGVGKPLTMSNAANL